MSSNMVSPGALSILKLSKEEREVLVDYLEQSKPELNSDLLDVMFGEKFLMVLDAFGGANVKFPTREYLEKTIIYIKIYSYCRSRGFTDESFELAGKIYKRRKVSVARIVDKVRQVLKEE